MKETSLELPGSLNKRGGNKKHRKNATAVTAERKNMHELAKLKIVLHDLDKELVTQKQKLNQQKQQAKRMLREVKSSTGASFGQQEEDSESSNTTSSWPLTRVIFSTPRLKAWKHTEKRLQKHLRAYSNDNKAEDVNRNGTSDNENLSNHEHHQHLNHHLKSASAVTFDRQTDNSNDKENKDSSDDDDNSDQEADDEASTIAPSRATSTGANIKNLKQSPLPPEEESDNYKQVANKLNRMQYDGEYSIHIRLADMALDSEEAQMMNSKSSPSAVQLKAPTSQKTPTSTSRKTPTSTAMGVAQVNHNLVQVTDIHCCSSSSSSSSSSEDEESNQQSDINAANKGISGFQMSHLFLQPCPYKPFVTRALSAYTPRSPKDILNTLSARRLMSANPTSYRSQVGEGEKENYEEANQLKQSGNTGSRLVQQMDGQDNRRRPRPLPGYMGPKRRRPKTALLYTATARDRDSENASINGE